MDRCQAADSQYAALKGLLMRNACGVTSSSRSVGMPSAASTAVLGSAVLLPELAATPLP